MRGLDKEDYDSSEKMLLASKRWLIVAALGLLSVIGMCVRGDGL